MSHITPLDQEINAWFESQSEETLRDLQDRFDAQTPRQAWKAFFNDCAFPAQQSSGDSLAAPAEAGQGVCISYRNAHQWRAIAYFLSGFETLASQGAQRLEGTRVSGEDSGREALSLAINFGGCVAPCTTSVPDGNHGDNFAGSRA